MTSGDTNAKTMELLDANAYFGPLERFEVFLTVGFTTKKTKKGGKKENVVGFLLKKCVAALTFRTFLFR